MNGYLSFAPEQARSSEGFQPHHSTELAQAEAGNFWFRSRNRLIIWALQHFFPKARNFLEIGCGTGFVLSGVAEANPRLEVSGSEIQIHSAGLNYAADRIKHAVLPGGGIILAVPQHRFLWSQQDEYACHVRRYEAQELSNKVEQARFQVERSTWFVSLLLPLMFLSRLSKGKPVENYDAIQEFQINGLLNEILEAVLDLERMIIRAGFSFPVGGSRLLVARKP